MIGALRKLGSSSRHAAPAWRHNFAAASRGVAQAKVGDRVPDVDLHHGFPPEKVPGYLAKQAEFKTKSVSDVLVYCVNDGAVMEAWAKDQNVDGSIITFMGDPCSDLTKALGMVLDHAGVMGVLGNPRCKRFSMFIENGEIRTVNVAEGPDDPAGGANPEVTLAEKMLSDIE